MSPSACCFTSRLDGGIQNGDRHLSSPNFWVKKKTQRKSRCVSSKCTAECLQYQHSVRSECDMCIGLKTKRESPQLSKIQKITTSKPLLQFNGFKWWTRRCKIFWRLFCFSKSYIKTGYLHQFSHWQFAMVNIEPSHIGTLLCWKNVSSSKMDNHENGTDLSAGWMFNTSAISYPWYCHCNVKNNHHSLCNPTIIYILLWPSKHGTNSHHC